MTPSTEKLINQTQSTALCGHHESTKQSSGDAKRPRSYMSNANTEATQEYAHNGNMSKSGRPSTKVRVHAMQENTKKV